MIQVDKNNFEEEVLKAEGPVLVDFWGPTCAPCKALMPEVEKLAQKYEGKVKFCKLDVSQNRRLAISQQVMGLPTILIYKNGEKVKELNRDVTPKKIEAMIQEVINE